MSSREARSFAHQHLHPTSSCQDQLQLKPSLQQLFLGFFSHEKNNVTDIFTVSLFQYLDNSVTAAGLSCVFGPRPTRLVNMLTLFMLSCHVSIRLRVQLSHASANANASPSHVRTDGVNVESLFTYLFRFFK